MSLVRISCRLFTLTPSTSRASFLPKSLLHILIRVSHKLTMLLNALLLLAASSLGPLGIDARTISHAPRALKERSFTTAVSRPTTLLKRSSAIAGTDNVVSLSKRSVKYNKRSAAYLLGKITDAAVTSTYANGSSSVLTSLFLGEEYATSITIGTQTFEVIVDTGSSDTVGDNLALCLPPQIELRLHTVSSTVLRLL